MRYQNARWRHFLRRVLVAGRIIARPAMTLKIMDRHPDPHELRPGQMIVMVRDGKPKCAYFQCPGNCGGHVQLSLDLLHRPRWSVRADFLARPTISPAVFRHRTCGAHFALHHGQIDWIEDTGHVR